MNDNKRKTGFQTNKESFHNDLDSNDKDNVYSYILL